MTVHTFATMGTVVSLRAAETAPVTAVEAVFAEADARFSLYRPDSEASRITRGDLALTAASDVMREAYAEALEWRTSTDGAFTPHRPDGVVDLAGTVKARAMAEAALLLGDGDWLLAVGGDVLCSGAAADSPWRVGIVDPADRHSLLCSVPLGAEQPAMATSGVAERGEHVWRRGHDAEEARIVQVTVLAPDILTADVLATAVLAGGPTTLDLVAERSGVDVLTVDVDGRLLATGRLRRLLTGAEVAPL